MRICFVRIDEVVERVVGIEMVVLSRIREVEGITKHVVAIRHGLHGEELRILIGRQYLGQGILRNDQKTSDRCREDKHLVAKDKHR